VTNAGSAKQKRTHSSQVSHPLWDSLLETLRQLLPRQVLVPPLGMPGLQQIQDGEVSRGIEWGKSRGHHLCFETSASYNKTRGNEID